MKKIFITTAFILAGILSVVSPALATTVSFYPSSIQVAKGQTASISLTVNPAGTTDYTEKVEVKFPANLLQVSSFNFGGTWMALNQPGYDSIDNVNGLLIKTAGYPGGFSSPMNLGTVTFRAIGTGSGYITVGSNSIAFQVNSQSLLTGPGASVTVTAPVAVTIKPVIVSTTTALTATSTATTTATTSLTASVGDFFKNLNAWVILLLVLLILETVAFIVYARMQKRRLR